MQDVRIQCSTECNNSAVQDKLEYYYDTECNQTLQVVMVAQYAKRGC